MLDYGLSDVRKEILGARQGLAECGIPAASIVGFRTPFRERLLNPKTLSSTLLLEP
jgi:hypothetical protein